MRLAPAIIMLLLAGAASLDASCTFTFDPPPMENGSAYTSSYAAVGFVFGTTSGLFHIDSGASAILPDNGTGFLSLPDMMRPLVVSNTSSFAFSLLRVDLAEYSTVVASPMDVPIIGHRTDGSTVQTTFRLDGVMDGTGPAADFQTFTFGAAFSGLSYVEIDTGLYSIDNLEIESVPEPAAGGLMLAGALGLCARRIRSRFSLTTKTRVHFASAAGVG